MLVLFVASALAMIALARWAGHDLRGSDGISYLRWSLLLGSESHAEIVRRWVHAWVPAYPAVLWVARMLTGGMLGASALLFGTNLGFALLGAVAIKQVSRAIDPRAAVAGMAAFLFFPFASYDFAFLPRADTMAIAVLLLAVLAYLGHRWAWFAVCCAIGLVTQKALWPFIALLCLAAWFRRGARSWCFTLIPAPLLGYWAYGMSLGLGPGFLVGRSVALFVPEPRASLPLFKGIEASLRAWPAPNKVGKALAVLAVLVVAAALLIWAWRTTQARNLELVFVFTLPLILAAALLNDHELLRVVRYGQLLVIPAVVFTAHSARVVFSHVQGWMVASVAGLCFLSHLAFFGLSVSGR